MLREILKAVPEMRSSEHAKSAAELHGALAFDGAAIGRTKDAIFLYGTDGVWEISHADITASRELEHYSGAIPDGAVAVRFHVKRGARVTLLQEFEVGVSLVAPTAAITRDHSSGTCSCSRSTQATTRDCPSGCWMCPNGHCCCSPMTRCLSNGCAP